MELEPARFALKSKQQTEGIEGASQAKKHRTVEALLQGGSGKDDSVLARLVAVLARLALTSAAELRDIAGLVFVTLLLPIEGAVAKATKAAGATCHETAQALKKSNDERGLEELGPPRAHIFMAMVMGINQEACEQTSKETIYQFWMAHIKDKGAQEVQESAMHCKCRPTKPKENKPGMVKLSFALNSKHAAVQDALVVELRRRGGAVKRGPAPRGPLERAAQQLLDEYEGTKKGKGGKA
ncbi:unnamed protein product [Prorocentrum cordatum]|uniref:Uncharacterized protein n=1 Tax=Prorocentrum cordatum TaxID=2364126 RepID=A0ABN9Y494_9DINO|nr:unnamed protein product [Polarella glacialis]